MAVAAPDGGSLVAGNEPSFHRPRGDGVRTILRKSFPLVMHPGFQSYDCTGCGDCCRGRFAILIGEDDKDRIVTQNWSADELELKGKPLFVRRGDEYQLAHRPDGSCIFLQDDGLCRIHAKFGEPAKPLACRLYPFRLIPVGDKIRVDVRFDCPATASNHGRPIEQHRADLQKLLKDAVPEAALAMPAPPLHGRIEIGWAQLCRITEAFERVLLDVSFDITRRVVACVDLVDLIRQVDLAKVPERSLGDFLDEAVGHVQHGVADADLERVEPIGREAAAFRQIVGVYGRIDQVGERANPVQRLSTSIRMLTGKGTLPPLRPELSKVGFADIENMRGGLSGDSAAAAERYLHTHLSSMSFFGPSFYNRTYLEGLGALLLTYPLTCWFARAYALSDSLNSLNRECVERALMIVDHQHGITPILAMPTERVRMGILTERSILRSLVVWYGT